MVMGAALAEVAHLMPSAQTEFFARVGAYYHDIGKIKKPVVFR
jgi:membrane-associated HD superfamily phosphohydrolase